MKAVLTVGEVRYNCDRMMKQDVIELKLLNDIVC